MSVLKFLSTPSGWRATITFWSALAVAADFYPRPPGGGRLGFHRDVRKAIEFLSTPSGWRATSKLRKTVYQHDVFLSTPSGWRATLIAELWTAYLKAFLSTPSGWRATVSLSGGAPDLSTISIHALRVEGDRIGPKSSAPS